MAIILPWGKFLTLRVQGARLVEPLKFWSLFIVSHNDTKRIRVCNGVHTRVHRSRSPPPAHHLCWCLRAPAPAPRLAVAVAAPLTLTNPPTPDSQPRSRLLLTTRAHPPTKRHSTPTRYSAIRPAPLSRLESCRLLILAHHGFVVLSRVAASVPPVCQWTSCFL